MGVWLDDEFPEHPKVEALDDDLARWLYVAGLCYANRNLTGGRIPKGAALRLTDKASKRLIDKLLAAPVPGHGPLWEDHGDHYRIHGFTPKRRCLPKQVRTLVLERGGHRCAYCGAVNRLSIDHIEPVVRGGSDELENLQVLCTPCNSSKGAR